MADLWRELDARDEEIEGLRKPESQAKLSGTLHGIQRVPPLLHLTPESNLADINCSNYNILASEPLHDLKGYVHNVLEELPAQIEDKEEAVNLFCLRICYLYAIIRFLRIEVLSDRFEMSCGGSLMSCYYPPLEVKFL